MKAVFSLLFERCRIASLGSQSPFENVPFVLFLTMINGVNVYEVFAMAWARSLLVGVFFHNLED